jgi:hypothetical protein
MVADVPGPTAADLVSAEAIGLAAIARVMRLTATDPALTGTTRPGAGDDDG